MYSHIKLKDFCFEVFRKTGCSKEDAELAATVLIEADLRGVDSHGIARLSGYVRLWEAGRINCAPDVTITYHNNRNNGFISGKNYFKASAICEEFVIHGTYDLKQWVHSMIHTLEFAATEQEEINELRLIPHNNYPDDNKQIYCRQLNSVVDYESLNCLGCQAAINCAEPDCIQCQWRDYVSRKEGNLSIVNPYEEYRRVNWLLDKRLLPEHMTV